MEKARARGKAVGRPVVVGYMDRELVLKLRSQGKSWKEIALAHPLVKVPPKGRRVKPSIGSIRRVFDDCQKASLDSLSDQA